MNTNISDQNERILEEAVSSGQFKDTQEALAEAVRLLGEQTADQKGVMLPAGAWRERFRRHLERTPSTAAVEIDMSRERIYEGRGE